MPSRFAFPPAAMRSEIPRHVPLQIVSPSAEPPVGDGWLHEIKHDGHRLLVIVTGGDLKLISRNGYDRTHLFRAPFAGLAGPDLVLDGEIAVPDERGVTHIDLLTRAMRQHRPESLAYFAFDLLHLDGHDLRACAIEDRKALLRDVIGAAGCPRIVVVDHMTGNGAALFTAVRQIGAEGIVSKRAGSTYCGGPSRDWLKIKVSETAAFVITGYIERAGGAEGRASAAKVAAWRAPFGRPGLPGRKGRPRVLAALFRELGTASARLNCYRHASAEIN